MKTVLGLLEMVLWIGGTIALAAAVTYIVVKVSPSGKKKPPAPAEPS